MEQKDAITMKENPKTLLGSPVEVGAAAPDFNVVDGGFGAVALSDFKGKALLISAVPSLDTGVCAQQTKRFNEELDNLPDDVAVVTISSDLPFAQARFCEAENVDKIQILSDCVDHNFGQNYGILIKDMGLLARAVFVIGKDGVVAYKELVPEVTSHPDYDKALEAIRAAAK